MENKEYLTFDRRDFITATVSGLLYTALSSSPLNAAVPVSKIKAIAFDAFVIFDPRPIFTTVNQLFPDKGKELIEVWRTKQFEYSWLRAIGGAYKDFWEVTEDALVFSARKAGVILKPEDKATLMKKYKTLDIWPDVLLALQWLKRKDVKLVFLSNFTGDMLRSSAGYAKIESYFDYFISTDEAKTYKPNPAAYQLGMERLKLKKEEILFAAFAGWDASGAKWFGYPTFWVNRQSAPGEELGVVVDGAGTNLGQLLNYMSKKK